MYYFPISITLLFSHLQCRLGIIFLSNDTCCLINANSWTRTVESGDGKHTFDSSGNEACFQSCSESHYVLFRVFRRFHLSYSSLAWQHCFPYLNWAWIVCTVESVVYFCFYFIQTHSGFFISYRHTQEASNLHHLFIAEHCSSLRVNSLIRMCTNECLHTCLHNACVYATMVTNGILRDGAMFCLEGKRLLLPVCGCACVHTCIHPYYSVSSPWRSTAVFST